MFEDVGEVIIVVCVPHLLGVAVLVAVADSLGLAEVEELHTGQVVDLILRELLLGYFGTNE